jgi:hypothetical protein
MEPRKAAEEIFEAWVRPTPPDTRGRPDWH